MHPVRTAQHRTGCCVRYSGRPCTKARCTLPLKQDPTASNSRVANCHFRVVTPFSVVNGIIATGMSVCLCARKHISGTTVQYSTDFCRRCCLWPLLGPSLAALRYVMYTAGYLHIMARNKRRDKGVYSTWFDRGQHRFDSAVSTQTDP